MTWIINTAKAQALGLAVGFVAGIVLANLVASVANIF